MSDEQYDGAVNTARTHRRWVRGSIFWLLIVLTGLIAGSWVKSYWRYDMIEYSNGTFRYRIIDNRARLMLSRFPVWSWSLRQLHHQSGPCTVFNASWRLGGIYYERNGAMMGIGRTLLIPHWLLLFLCAAAAWWASRPWRKRRAETRGFEVVVKE